MEKLQFTVLKDWVDALLRRDHLMPSLRGKAAAATIKAMTHSVSECLWVSCDVLMTRIEKNRLLRSMNGAKHNAY